MRFRHPDGSTVHVAYCTNVHPAEDLPGVLAQLDTYAVPVREVLGTDVLGLGLWLAAPVASALAAEPAPRLRLRRELASRGLEVVTLNGFPFSAFQQPVVKHNVYRPDWTEPLRLAYTLDLARVLVDLLPDDARRGSISTLPFAWREPWSPAEHDLVRRHVDSLSRGLADLERVTGRRVRVAFEPEPGCVIETTTQAATLLSTVDTAYLGVCLDLAHLACAWEEPAEAVGRLFEAGLSVVKCQVSAALEVKDPVGAASVVRGYAEPRFLHQTRTAGGHAYDDLPEALDAAPTDPWRVHFHIPLHAEPAPPLGTTTPVLRAALSTLVGGDRVLCDHLEVETYTWGVLPEALRPVDDAGLAAGIAAELAYARDELLALGLTAIPAGAGVHS